MVALLLAGGAAPVCNQGSGPEVRAVGPERTLKSSGLPLGTVAPRSDAAARGGVPRRRRGGRAAGRGGRRGGRPGRQRPGAPEAVGVRSRLASLQALTIACIHYSLRRGSDLPGKPNTPVNLRRFASLHETRSKLGSVRGQTPLDLALEKERWDVVRVLRPVPWLRTVSRSAKSQGVEVLQASKGHPKLGWRRWRLLKSQEELLSTQLRSIKIPSLCVP